MTTKTIKIEISPITITVTMSEALENLLKNLVERSRKNLVERLQNERVQEELRQLVEVEPARPPGAQLH
jgi:hypothetical protein